MTIAEKIKDTKDNGIYYECSLIGDGTDENPYRPEIFKYKGYYHFDTSTINAGKCRIWINKNRTKSSELTKIKNDNKFTKIKETSAGAIVE